MSKKETGTILKPMIYDEREHLKHPIPRPMEINVVGKSLTQKEWQKFCALLEPQKLEAYCERKHDGRLLFFGEEGLDAANILQNKFKDRFHFGLFCKNKIIALVGLGLAQKHGVPIYELGYRDTDNVKKYVSQPLLNGFAAQAGANDILQNINLRIS